MRPIVLLQQVAGVPLIVRVIATAVRSGVDSFVSRLACHKKRATRPELC